VFESLKIRTASFSHLFTVYVAANLKNGETMGETTRRIILIVDAIGMLLYESHSLFHLRSLPSKGRYFAYTFIYFVSAWHSF